MGRKRYYCDYCDRSLPYSVEARKKHNHGHQHRLAKQAYFNSIKSASEEYSDEISKTNCKRFFSGQNCAFGKTCIFSHKTEGELDYLKKEAEAEHRKKCTPSQISDKGEEPSLEYILSVLEENNNPSLKLIIDTVESYNKASPHLKTFEPLPPSLKPPKFDDLLMSEFSSWG